MALLINFSMFFTKVVIDSSNILALVFYNKLDTTPATGNATEFNTGSTPNNEKNVSGTMYRKFDVTKLMDKTTIDKLKTQK